MCVCVLQSQQSDIGRLKSLPKDIELESTARI